MPVILLSARAGEEARVEGLEAGADDYLVKPFSARELLARVGGALELARVRREAAASLRGSEEALRQRTAQFETLVAEAPLGVYLVDDELRIGLVNAAARAAFGDIPDLVGRDYGEVIRIALAAPPTRTRSCSGSGTPSRPASRTARPSGPSSGRDRGVTEYYDLADQPHPAARRPLRRRLLLPRHLARRCRRAPPSPREERLRQAAKMEAIGRLAGGLAHDFNNQLHALGGFAGFASPGPRASAASRGRTCDEVQKAAERMANLTRQLLAFSRQQVLRPEVLDLDQAVGDGEELLRRLIGSQIEFRLEPRPGRQVGAGGSRAAAAGADEPLHQRPRRDARGRATRGSRPRPARCAHGRRERPARRTRPGPYAALR